MADSIPLIPPPSNRDAMDKIAYAGWVIVIIGVILGLTSSIAQAQVPEYVPHGLERGSNGGLGTLVGLVGIMLGGAVLFSLIFAPTKSSSEEPKEE